MSQTYENLDSSAINKVIIEDNGVKVFYNSKIDKEYHFSCENTAQFQQVFEEEMQKTDGSLGKLMRKVIREGMLVETAKISSNDF